MLLLAACSAPAPVPAGGPSLSILTYNVNFERFDPSTVDAIVAADADLVFLQETTAAWEEAIRARLVDTYPTMLFHPHEPDGGMGVLARVPIAGIARLDSPVGKFPATRLRAETELGPLDILHVHLHPPLDENGLLTGYFTTDGKRWAEVNAYVADDVPDVVVGDFNEGEGYALGLLEDRGLHDAASAFPPPVRTWSWQSDWGELEGRPDHVYLAPTLAPVAVEVREAGASDHRPLRVVVQRSR